MAVVSALLMLAVALPWLSADGESLGSLGFSGAELAVPRLRGGGRGTGRGNLPAPRRFLRPAGSVPVVGSGRWTQPAEQHF